MREILFKQKIDNYRILDNIEYVVVSMVEQLYLQMRVGGSNPLLSKTF